MIWKMILPCLLICIYYPLFAQGTAGAKAQYESRYVVDMPTAGIIEKGELFSEGLY